MADPFALAPEDDMDIRGPASAHRRAIIDQNPRDAGRFARGVGRLGQALAEGFGSWVSFPMDYARAGAALDRGEVPEHMAGQADPLGASRDALRHEAVDWSAGTGIGMLGMGTLPGGAPSGATLGIVPVDVARRIGIKKLPQSETFDRAVAGTPGARVDEGSLVMSVGRRQHPDQEMSESVRGGVFYLPAGDANFKHYGTGRSGYGGAQKIEGETAFNNPLFVKGATGGKAPAAAYDQMHGKGAYEAMRRDALQTTTAGWMDKRDPSLRVELAQRFLSKYAPEMSDLAEHILQNSTRGNQLAYALQEAAVASAARNAGHDAVLGYSTRRKTKEPFISEVFDVRENRYPSPSGDYSIWGSLAPE